MVVAVALVTLAACSGGGGSDGDAADLDGGLTGPPILVGLINQEDAPLGSFPELRRGAEAAVATSTPTSAGSGDAPCASRPAPPGARAESSQACATKLAACPPGGGLGGVDLGSAASLPVLEEAGIPYVGSLPQLGEELTVDGRLHARRRHRRRPPGPGPLRPRRLHAKRIGALYVDLPGVLTTVVQAAEIVLKAKGATDVKLVAAKADEADFTPALKAATAGNPDVVFVVFPAQACARIMEAAQAAVGEGGRCSTPAPAPSSRWSTPPAPRPRAPTSGPPTCPSTTRPPRW